MVKADKEKNEKKICMNVIFKELFGGIDRLDLDATTGGLTRLLIVSTLKSFR